MARKERFTFDGFQPPRSEYAPDIALTDVLEKNTKELAQVVVICNEIISIRRQNGLPLDGASLSSKSANRFADVKTINTLPMWTKENLNGVQVFEHIIRKLLSDVAFVEKHIPKTPPGESIHKIAS